MEITIAAGGRDIVKIRLSFTYSVEPRPGNGFRPISMNNVPKTGRTNVSSHIHTIDLQLGNPFRGNSFVKFSPRFLFETYTQTLKDVEIVWIPSVFRRSLLHRLRKRAVVEAARVLNFGKSSSQSHSLILSIYGSFEAWPKFLKIIQDYWFYTRIESEKTRYLKDRSVHERFIEVHNTVTKYLHGITRSILFSENVHQSALEPRLKWKIGWPCFYLRQVW